MFKHFVVNLYTPSKKTLSANVFAFDHFILTFDNNLMIPQSNCWMPGHVLCQVNLVTQEHCFKSSYKKGITEELEYFLGPQLYLFYEAYGSLAGR